MEDLSSKVSKRVDVDSQASHRSGARGWIELGLRKFRAVAHMALLVPLYTVGCLIIAIASSPAILFFRFVHSQTGDWDLYLKVPTWGFSLASAYLMYGYTLIMVVPLANLIMRTSLKPWRGPYYSFESIPWYIHNGAVYIVRFTFLEFITPTPFNLLYFRLMGMKIGEGSVINSAHISDPSLISLGRKVTIGGSVTIVAHYGQDGYLVLAPVCIGDRATIGLRATIMGGVEIGAGAKVLPNSVVMPKTIIPPGETWGGVPATRISTPKAGLEGEKHSA